MTEKKKLFGNKILKELYFDDNLSCAELSIKIEKSFPVTAKLIEELITADKVVETGHAASPRRQSVLYVCNIRRL